LGKAKPLVFLNACQTGRGGLSLTDVGGWAAGLLRAGAGAFVGPLWSIRDSRALAFARVFYREVLAGETVGEAAHQAREELRKQFPGDPSRLGYVLYAQPHAAARSRPAREPVPLTASIQPKPPIPGPPEPRRKPPGPSPRPSAEPEPGAERLHEKDGTVLLYVPGGTYTLGAEDLPETARPVHRVRLSPFWIGKYPVTNEQYGRFLKENPDQREPQFWNDEIFNQPRQPVVGVSRAEAEAYCRWAGLRLPSEAQWEAAARGQDGRRFPWGDALPTPELANFGGKTGGPTAVDSHPPGAGPFGTLDQAGNVWEWCADSWSLTAYKERAEGEPDPLMPGDASFCVVRGGSWLNPAQDLYAACREGATASLRQKNQGFRCVLWAAR
jgi:formylglycine-generating enzyme required for sulfatase activity